MDRFTDWRMLELAKIYRDYECLWNVKNPEYKTLHVRYRAYEEIAEKLNIPGVTAKDIPKKIKNLRSSYHQELKKIYKSVQAGDAHAYTPRVAWFAIVDELFNSIANKQETSMNIDENSKNSDNDSETCNPVSVENIKVEENSNSSEEEIEDYGCAESNHDEEPKESENVRRETCSHFAVPNRRRLKYTENLRTEDLDMSRAIAKIDKIASRVCGKSNLVEEKQEDEFDVFGKYIALVLRSLPPELAVQAKMNLHKSLTDVQLSAMRKEPVEELPHST